MPSYDHVLAQEQQAFDVIGKVGHSDLGRRPGDADGSDEQDHPMLLLCENMFNA
jgi:hypothetical protein